MRWSTGVVVVIKGQEGRAQQIEQTYDKPPTPPRNQLCNLPDPAVRHSLFRLLHLVTDQPPPLSLRSYDIIARGSGHRGYPYGAA